MKGNKSMDSKIIEKYMNTIYAYARKRTFSTYEAEELAADIMYEIVKSINTIKDQSRFEAWMWGLADNVVKTFRRKMLKEKAMYSYDLPDNYSIEEEVDNSNEEQYLLIRQKVSMLSKMYRDIIILHYYDNLSTKQIAVKLNIPEGTVTWRLKQAREKIKKEILNMNECALKPVKMSIGIYGSGNFDGKKIPFPDIYISDALSQNILYYCYEKPKSIEELAKCCGVPAYYIEESIKNLLKREAIIEITKGKYQTAFIIWSDKYKKFEEENVKKVLTPIMDDLIQMIKCISKEANKIGFYKANKSDNDLLYLFGAKAFEFGISKNNPLKKPKIKMKYDGNYWCYTATMESDKYKRNVLKYASYNKSECKYSYAIHYGFSNVSSRQLLRDDSWIDEYINLFNGGKINNQDAFERLIEGGYIIKDSNGILIYTIPVLSKEQEKEFYDIVDKYFEPLSKKYTECVVKFVSEYKKHFPKQLEEEVERTCNSIYYNLYCYIIGYAISTSQIIPPSKNLICDIMIEK